MKKIIRFKLHILLLVFITSCEYHCDGFLEEYDKYVTFELNDTISYSNGIDTLNFTVIDYFRNEPSSFTGLAMDVDCNYEKYYQTDIQNGYFIREHFNNFFSRNDDIEVSFTENDTFGLNTYNVSSENYDYSTVEFYQNLSINGSEYNDVYYLLKDTINDNPKIGYIIKANPGGIIEFYDFETKEKWNLIE